MKKKKNNICLDNKAMEDFIWMSYRYCIGRKTIAAATHADTIREFINNNPVFFTSASFGLISASFFLETKVLLLKGLIAPSSIC